MIFKNDRTGFGLWFDTWFGEDMYFTSSQELKDKYNHKRKKRLFFQLTFFLWTLAFSIPLKTVGHICYGRDMKKVEARKKLRNEKTK